MKARLDHNLAREKWAEHLKNQKASGQTQREYCREHGLSPISFSNWKTKLASPPAPMVELKRQPPVVAGETARNVLELRLSDTLDLILTLRLPGRLFHSWIS
jgi:hypothetical protein